MLKNILKKSFIYFCLLFLAKIATAIFFIFLARFFGPIQFGQLVFFITLNQICVAFFDFGLREFYQKKAHLYGDKFFKTIFWQRGKLLIVNLIIIIIFNSFFSLFSFIDIIFFLFIVSFESLLSVIDGFYLFAKKSHVVAYKLLLRNFWLFVFLFLFIYPQQTLFSFYLSYAISNGLVLIFYLPWKNLWSNKIIKLARNYSPAFFYLNSLSMLYSKSDSLIIEHFLGSKFLGFYGAAYRYLESINLFATAIFHNLFPVASKKNNLSFFNLMRIVVFMFGISLFFSCFLYFGAELLTIVILGAEYLPSKEIVQIFALLIILFFTNSPLITTIAASSQLKKFLPWASINTLFNIIVNLLVVDTYGIKGIAWTMVASEILAIIINVVFIYKIYFKNETN